MSRFDREWAVVPQGARWIAAFVGLVVAASIGGIFFVPFLIERDLKGFFIFGPFFLLALLGGAAAAVYTLFIGYVYGDARRRRMNHVLWTLLAIFIPNAIGIILYFILRDPVPMPCPACGTAAPKGHAFCASCGAAVRAACPQCRQPVEAGWRMCAHCGTSLTAAAASPAGVRS
jgi:hypothetical protein